MFKLLYVLGGAIIGAAIVENIPSANAAFLAANTKVKQLVENTKHRFADMEL